MEICSWSMQACSFSFSSTIFLVLVRDVCFSASWVSFGEFSWGNCFGASTACLGIFRLDDHSGASLGTNLLANKAGQWWSFTLTVTLMCIFVLSTFLMIYHHRDARKLWRIQRCFFDCGCCWWKKSVYLCLETKLYHLLTSTGCLIQTH